MATDLAQDNLRKSQIIKERVGDPNDLINE